jgi:hypothetical protein
MSRFPAWGTVPTRPRCACCDAVIVVDIGVDDELWCAVMREKFGPGYVCVNCFASRADEKLIDWAPHVKLTAISFVAQMQVQYGAEAAARDFGSGFTSGSSATEVKEALAIPGWEETDTGCARVISRKALPERYCNKCGYFGPDEVHAPATERHGGVRLSVLPSPATIGR